MDVQIYLPPKNIYTLVAFNGTGSLNLTVPLTANIFEVNTYYGLANIEQIVANEITVSTQSGYISMSHITASNSITTNSESGQIHAKNITSGNSFTATSESGAIKITTLNSPSITTTSESGATQLNNIEFESLQTISSTSQSGAIEVYIPVSKI